MFNNKSICIYCRGDFGLQTYYKLKEKGVWIDYFADRNPQKQGYALEGLYCKSYEELLKADKEDVILIVAIKKPEELIEHFRQKGFPYVYDKETAVEMLKGVGLRKAGKPVRDMALIEQMKKNIQKMIYDDEDGCQKQAERDIIRDYRLRHGKDRKRQPVI